MASKFEINIDRNRSGRAYLNMSDLGMDTATDWVVIDPPFDQAPAEVAFACAYLNISEPHSPPLGLLRVGLGEGF